MASRALGQGLPVGSDLGHYRILEKLGEGGMGVVYKARDTHLDRFVAIKVLPAQKVADPERKQRFVQEAKAASSLNHPNIITIYDIGQAEGVDFISMEYIAGKTLDRLIPRHGMRLNEALKCSVQIADALARAHSVGIIHRDLKPGNIMVNEHGLVKVLDFGLAKLTEAIPADGDDTTRSMRPTTEEGKIVGTVAYMSPEQAEGKKVDARSDIFSFGSVLYEMVTGGQAFQGDTKASTLAAILKDNPRPASQTVDGLPREVERLISRCLQKEVNQRFQHMDDVKIVLEELKEESDSGVLGTVAVSRTKPRRRLTWAVSAAAALVIAMIGVWLRTPLPSSPRILGSKQITNDGLPKFGPVTDGSRLYFTETPPDRYSISQVSSTGGEVAAVDVPFTFPVVNDVSSEQSELLVYQATTDPTFDSFFWSIPVPAGSPRRLQDVIGHGAVWTPKGKLVFVKGNDFYIAEHDGANPRKFATAPDLPQFISFSPDETRMRFTVTNLVNGISAIWEARADGSNMHPLFPGWNTPPNECCGRWTPDGKYYVFQSSREGASNIWIVPERSEFWRKSTREPIQLTTGPLQFANPLPSKDGKKLFVIGVQPRAELVRYDSKSGDFVPFLGGISAGDVDFSRDGQQVTYVSYPDYTLWRSKLDGSARLRLTYPPMQAALAHWSPDGQRIAFSGITPGKPWKVFLISKDGGSPEPLTMDEVQETDPTWAPDGKTLALGHYDPLHSERTFIELFDLRTHQISQLPRSQGIFGPRWSPDGRYIIAVSYDNSKLMVCDVKAGKWRQLDTNLRLFGYIAWSKDSAYVYFDTFTDSGYFRLRISDSKVERLADLKKLRKFSDPFSGYWTGLGPGDTPLIARDISTQEIYALDLQLR
jgi:serine/threonine protein kinase/Tol biopolymer transport system component